MIKFKEYLSESAVKVETYNGMINYDLSEIEDMIDYPDMYETADNLPKWIGQALRIQLRRPTNKNIRSVTRNILDDIMSGKIKKIEFNRDNQRNIIGLKNIDVNNTRMH